MKLLTLFKGYSFQGPKRINIEVKGVKHDSRYVMPGDVYVCLNGLRVDGHLFAPDAVARGAVAVVAEKPLELNVPVLVVNDTRHALSFISARYFAHPSRKLNVVGVTGTNGKTTTTHFLQSIYRAAGRQCAIIGTVGIKIGEHCKESTMTTPEAFDLHRTFHEIAKKKVNDVAMEVSSHSLSWQRVEHVSFDSAVFLNLSHDHLDFHKDMEDYFMSKAHLFELLQGKCAVVNIDDTYGQRLLVSYKGPALTFGMHDNADVRGTILKGNVSSSELKIQYNGVVFTVQVCLPGEFNAYNALAAAAQALAENVEPSVIARGINELCTVPGRLEALNFEQQFNIFIDFAHTPDGLEKVLKMLRTVKHNRLITLFGCPGDRDKSKRPIMGSIAENYSDMVIITTDNPASEDPEAIIKEILVGMKKSPVVIPDRTQAVQHALSVAGKGDIVLLAGKGHESYQLMGDIYEPYSDRQAVEKYFIS